MAANKLRWLGHSCLHLSTADGLDILVDPWISNPNAPSDLAIEKLDWILLTHAHGDHLGETVSLARQYECPIVAIYELASFLGASDLKTTALNKGGKLMLGKNRLHMVHADHSSAIVGDDGTVNSMGEAAGYVLELADGPTIYLAGDTALFGDMMMIADVYHPSVACLPIDGSFTMGPEHAANASQWLGVQRVLPIHHGSWPGQGTPEQLRTVLAASAIEVLSPSSSEWVGL